MCFEPKQSAKKRRHALDTLAMNEPAAKKKKKDHTGNTDAMHWDKQAMKQEVEGYEDTHFINFQELADRYNVQNDEGGKANNGGQIVKEWLLANNVNLDRFHWQKKGVAIVRRRKRRGPGGEISLPTEAHPSVIKKKLADKLESGEYTIGQVIVPRKVIAMSINLYRKHHLSSGIKENYPRCLMKVS